MAMIRKPTDDYAPLESVLEDVTDTTASPSAEASVDAKRHCCVHGLPCIIATSRESFSKSSVVTNSRGCLKPGMDGFCTYYMPRSSENVTDQNPLNKIREDYNTELPMNSKWKTRWLLKELLSEVNLEEKFIVKDTNEPCSLVGSRRSIEKETLKQGTSTTLRQLPREVDPLVYKMSHEDPGHISYAEVGGLAEQIRELREVVELPLINPDLFKRVGITPPKGCLLYGPPGTGKTLLAHAVASQLDCNFLKVVSFAIVDKYIGESARMIREMFNYARDHQPCIVFMDEIDAIGGRRFSEGTSADREIQRTLMELLNQMDGFDSLGKVKIIMATNRPDTLDPALLRPGRLDRKIEIGLPNEQSRLEVLKIHASTIAKHGEIDYEAVVKLSEGFSGADLRNVCTEAGLFAIRAEREYVVDEDFMKAVRKVADAKKLETKLDYKPV